MQRPAPVQLPLYWFWSRTATEDYRFTRCIYSLRVYFCFFVIHEVSTTHGCAAISFQPQEASHLCSSELASQRWSGLELSQRHWDLKNTRKQILWRTYMNGSRHSIMWPPFSSIEWMLNCSPIIQFSTFCNDWWSIFFWIKSKTLLWKYWKGLNFSKSSVQNKIW